MKKSVITCIVGVILSACGDGGSTSFPTALSGAIAVGGSASGAQGGRLFQRNQVASGAYQVPFSGNGERIGILEGKSVYNGNAEYRNRIEYGLKAQGGRYTGVIRNDVPAFQSARARHADMVTSVAIGKTFGIAHRARAVDYNYAFPIGNSYYSNHIELGRIYSDAKSRNLVAMNNSWRTWLHAEYTRGRNGYDSSAVQRVQAAATTLGVDIDGNGVNMQYIFGKRCSKYSRYLTYAENGHQVYTSQYRAISQQELQSTYDSRCKGGYSPYASRSVYEKYIGADFIRQIEADSTNDRDAPIWVWAAGNDNEENGSLFASLPAQIPKAEDYWLAVVATEYTSGQYRHTRYSATCGRARRYCLTAVSEGARHVTYDDRSYGNGGTSAAAPSVTAGLAVVKQAFPSKDRRWARRRILATASHITADGKRLRDANGNIVTPDAQGYSNIFGRGIMRLDKAIQPMGNSVLSVSGASLEGAEKYSVQDSFIHSSPVFGDGLKQGLSNIDTKKFDAMGAEFDYNMGDGAFVTAATTPSRFLDFDGQNVSYTPTLHHIGTSNMSFVDTDPYRFANFTYTEQNLPFMPKAENPKRQPLHMSYAYDADKAIQISIPNHEDYRDIDSMSLQFVYGKLTPTVASGTVRSVGLHTEQGTVLGSNFRGAYGGVGRTNTVYMNRTTHWQWGDWNLRYNSVFGISTSNGIGGRSIQNISGLLSSNFSVIARKEYRTGQLGIAFYQPLRVERGVMDVSFVSDVRNNTMVSYDTQQVDITPSGREIAFEAYYDFANSPFTVKTHISKDKNHIKGKDDTTVLLRYFKPFK